MGNRAYQLYQKQKAETYKKGFEFKRKLEEEYYQANITPFVITNEEFVGINDKNKKKDIKHEIQTNKQSYPRRTFM